MIVTIMTGLIMLGGTLYPVARTLWTVERIDALVRQNYSTFTIAVEAFTARQKDFDERQKDFDVRQNSFDARLNKVEGRYKQ